MVQELYPKISESEKFKINLLLILEGTKKDVC